MMMTYSSETY